MDLFESKKATGAFTDINANAASLQYHEILPKSQPANYDVSTQLQFDFGGATDRYVLLSESYFVVKYKVGYCPLATGTDEADRKPMVAIPAGGVLKDTGVATNDAKDALALTLKPRFFNHCVSSIRHSINGVDVESTNEAATCASLRDISNAHSYDQSAGSAYRTSLTVNQKLGSVDINQECAYRPPLGLYDCKVPIGGAQHSITFQLSNHNTYSAAVFDVPVTTDGSPNGKVAADFEKTAATALASAGLIRNRDSYLFGIEEVSLMLCTVQPQSMIVPGPSLLIENRSIEVHRVDNSASRSINKQMQLPGSTYRTDLFFSGDEPNGIDTSVAEPLDKESTKLESLALSVSGQAMYTPQLEGLMGTKIPMMPYTQYLATTGNLTNNAMSSVKDQEEFSKAPHYHCRVVQPPTTAPRDTVVRANFSDGQARTVVIGAHYSSAIALFYDASGHVTTVAINT